MKRLNKLKRRIAAVAAGMYLLCACCGALADVKLQETRRGGRVTEAAWVDDQGKTTAGPDGYAIVRYTYKDRDTTEMYFNAEGEPCVSAGGYYGRIVTRDAKDRVSGIQYLDASGERMLNMYGYGRVTMVYTSFGELRTLKYYGLGKDTVTVPSLGYAMIEADYSGKSMTRWTYLDPDGALTEGPEGYAAVYQKVDGKYKVIQTRYTHADGSPATCADGWSSSVTERDAKERVISVKYYDESGALTDRGLGYAYEKNEWSGNRQVTVTRYSLSGEKVPLANGAFSLLKTLRDDLVTREMYLNASGEPMTDGQGIAGVSYGYDSEGRLESVTYLNAAGDRALCAEGYAGYRDTRGENGMILSRIWIGEDGLKTDRSGGYAEARYSYDASGALSATRYYNAAGAQVQAE